MDFSTSPQTAAAILARLGLGSMAAGALAVAASATAFAPLAHPAAAGQLLTSSTGTALAWSGTGLTYASGLLSHVGAAGIQTRQAATQDAVLLLGRAGGTNSYALTLTPTTLTGNRTATFPDAAIVVSGSAAALTSGRVPFSATGGLLTDNVGFQYPAHGGANQVLNNQTFTDLSAGRFGYQSLINLTPAANSSAQNAVIYAVGNTNAGSAFNYTNAVSAFSGLSGETNHYGTGTASVLNGVYFGANARPGCGVVDTLQGGQLLVQNLHTTQPVTTGVGLRIYSPQNSGGNFGTYKGVFISAASVGTTNCIGIDIGAMTGTGPLAIRTAAGIVSLGDTTDATTLSAAGTLLAGGLATAAGKSILAGGKILSLGATHGVGYGTGAGGTVTQATSKATGVTLSKVCGTITLDAANLAADTSVSFTWTNTAIAATDVVALVHDSVGALGGYGITVTPSAGSATVTVRNNTAGALAEAIVLRFVVLKAVTA